MSEPCLTCGMEDPPDDHFHRLCAAGRVIANTTWKQADWSTPRPGAAGGQLGYPGDVLAPSDPELRRCLREAIAEIQAIERAAGLELPPIRLIWPMVTIKR